MWRRDTPLYSTANPRQVTRLRASLYQRQTGRLMGSLNA
ncbi:Uncharacterised protein [Vibrio cholerae]|nr:Uncharacterised protein [Vibrio cholerae]